MGPPRVQIQTQAGCNGRCVFCPNEDVIKSGLPHGKMAPDLFQKIVDELAEARPRRISPYLMNEPLNDKRLPEFVRYISERVPDSTSLVTTNGTALTEERAEALIRAGLKRLKVSLQSLDPEKNRAIMGYSSERVIENILATKRVMDRLRPKDFDFRVSTVVTAQNIGEIQETQRFWKRHGIHHVTSSLENRGGNIRNAEELNAAAMAARHNCIRPSREMCILYNGDVVLCCVDWFRTVVVGNLAVQSLAEVWNSPRLQQIRLGFTTQNLELLPDICLNCTESACPDRHRRGLKGILVRRLLGPLARR